MIFKPAARYPVDPRVVFILAFSVFTGVTALALDKGPESLESQLPTWGVIAWGVILTFGSMITLWGVARQTLNGILTEQVGSVMVGVATIFYSVLAIRAVGWDAIQSVGIIFAWGLACFVRWIQLQILVITAYHKQIREEAHELFRDAVRDGFNAPKDHS